MEVETIEHNYNHFGVGSASARVLALLTKNLVFPRKDDFGAPLLRYQDSSSTFGIIFSISTYRRLLV